MKTQAVGLDTAPSRAELETYVSACVPHCLQETFQNPLFKEINQIQAGQLLSDALKLFTAPRLLMKGWEVSEVPILTDIDSPYFNMRPAPRVLENELDHELEIYVADLELSLLGRLESHILKKRTIDWKQLASTVLVLLAVMERDIWRLVYWVRHKEQVS